MKTEFETIESQELDGVSGGWAWLARVAPFIGGLFGGGGTNANVQNGNDNRTAQGNSGTVNQGNTVINR